MPRFSKSCLDVVKIASISKLFEKFLSFKSYNDGTSDGTEFSAKVLCWENNIYHGCFRVYGKSVDREVVVFMF